MVDAGLTKGLGLSEPGHMCVEAAVAYAMGENHTDEPKCVDRRLGSIKIDLNDSDGWSSDASRAKGLRRIAIAQLGSAGKFKEKVFTAHIRKQWVSFRQEHRNNLLDKIQLPKVPAITRASILKDAGKAQADIKAAAERLAELAEELNDFPTILSKEWDLPSIADELSEYLPNMSVNDRLAMVAEWGVQALKKMKIPGTKFLYLTERKKRKAKVKHK